MHLTVGEVRVYARHSIHCLDLIKFESCPKRCLAIITPDKVKLNQDCSTRNNQPYDISKAGTAE